MNEAGNEITNNAAKITEKNHSFLLSGRKPQSGICGNDKPRHRHRIKSRNARFCENVEKPAAKETDQRGEIKLFSFERERNQTDRQDRRKEKRMRECAVREIFFDKARDRKKYFAVNRFRRINIRQQRHRAGNQ